jgi:hypothetical protein
MQYLDNLFVPDSKIVMSLFTGNYKREFKLIGGILHFVPSQAQSLRSG